MNVTEASGKAAVAICTALVEDGKTYWLCVRARKLIIVERNFVPIDGIKVFALTANMCKHGLASSEWDRLEAKLRQFCEGGLL